MKIQNNLIYKYSLIIFLIFSSIFSDFVIQNLNMNFNLTLSTIFIFIIIGVLSSNASLVIITILSLVLFGINGFNIITLIQTIEILYVWFFYKNNKKNIIFEVIIFELCFASPIIILTSYSNNVISIEFAYFIIMLFLNRVFNALISKMFLDYVPLERIFDAIYDRPKAVTLSNLVIQVSIASIVVPILLFSIATNSSNQDQISENAVKDLKSASEYLNKKVDSWSEQQKRNLRLLNPIEIYDLIDMVQIYVSRDENSVNFHLIDLGNKVISTQNSPEFMKNGLEWMKEGSVTEIEPKIYRWISPKDTRFIIRDYTRDKAYFYVTTIDKFKVIITVSATAYDDRFINFFVNLLKLIGPIFIFVGVFFLIMKRLMMNSIFELISITSGLPQKLKNNETVDFAKSNIYEIESLTINFRIMVDNLSSMILNVEATNKKLQESERLLYDQAHFDSLTGLPNRHYFIKKVEADITNFYIDEKFENKIGIAFFFIDLDKFKAVNDTYGHSTGDKLLKQVAAMMNNVLEGYDNFSTFIARMGGDEFVIEFIYDNKDDIAKLANALISTINKSKQIDNIILTTGISIGICIYPDDGEDIDSILLKSDSSMYKAKNSGGNKFFFYSNN